MGVATYFASSTVRTAVASMYAGSVACNTSTATSTLSYMSRGLGTTTMTCLTRSVDEMSVNAILVASSTETRYRYRVERSLNNIDWYADIAEIGELSSTTPVTGSFAEFSLRYASSTAGTSQTVVGTTANFINFKIKDLRADYTRIVFYLDNVVGSAATSTNGAIRAEGVVKERVTR